ncbi:MBL fold metallo-hydrolase [Marinicella sp. W31]|uniref:MBL fold metallo-hydrolase n=1 Tax=Marinicella sp. W31 TaxID=3023713 RepID=UPI0037571364
MQSIKYVLFIALLFSAVAQGHQQDGATYIGNEGVMITDGDTKVLFDPFFHNSYNIYQLVPEDIREAMFSGTAPYGGITAIFISHAHGDHFSAEDTLRFLKTHANTKLIAPQQAIDMLQKLPDSTTVKGQIEAIQMKFGDAPVMVKLNDLEIEAVRIPHAGWPQRADVSNLVFRVTLNDRMTVMHLGDADPDDTHYQPFADHWQSRVTHTAFPPYWFLTGEAGLKILRERLNTQHNIGVHVPVKVPAELRQSGEDFFSKPGERRSIQIQHKEAAKN